MGLVVVAILFLGSGRWDWIRAWVFVALTLGVQTVVGIRLHRAAPDLIAERSKIQKGTASWDKFLAPAVALGPLVIWGVSAWDVRGHWPPAVPVEWSIAAFAVCIAGMLFVFRAMMTNRFFSGTVRIQSDRGHVVVTGGPYRYVRHPGYAGALAFTLASPIALGSWTGLVPAVVVAAILVVRTALEDRTLRASLDGYEEYTRRTRARLIPGVW